MGRFVEAWRRLLHLVRRDRLSRELDAEMRFHLEMAAADLRAGGTSARDADFAARRQFGNVTRIKETSIDSWGWTRVEQWWRDLRLALRMLGRSPGFVVVAVFTLAVGIGANTAIFSVLHTVLFRPLPFEHPEALVSLRHTADVGPLRVQSAANYFTYRDERRAFDDIGLYSRVSRAVIVPGADGAEQVEVLVVTDGLLPILGVEVALGRRFDSGDDAAASPPRAILSHGYWQRVLDGDRGVVGRHLLVEGEPCEIVGVLPPRFRFLGYDPALLLPFRFNRATTSIGNFGPRGVARLKAGVTIEEANRDVARMIPLVDEKFPLPAGLTREEYKATFRYGPDVRPLASEVVGAVGPVLWVLMGTAGIVLLIACANVASLFLVRADGRQHELAVRAALGAGRLRIARELLTESVVLGVAGGALGLVLARAGIRLLVVLAPAGLPRLDEIAIDPIALVLTLGLSVFSGVAFGLLPVVRLSRPPLAALRDGGRSASEGRRRLRTNGLLVVAEVTLAMILLVGAGLMVRTFQAMQNVEVGVARPEEVLTFQLGVPRGVEPDIDQAVRTHERIVRRLEQIPGVASVGLTTSVPMDGRGETDGFLVEGFADPPGTPRQARRVKWVSERYFETLGTPLLAGRTLTWSDAHQRRPVVLVSENFARQYWGTPAAAIGRHLRETPDNPWREIVGVVGNERDDGLTADAPTVVYLPLIVASWWDTGTYGQRYLIYALRAATIGAPTFLKQVQQAVWSVDSSLPLHRVRTLEEIRVLDMARTRFTLVMLVLAAAVALVLGAVGIYGVVSYAVSGQSREIGIRIALGARAGEVRRLFLRRGITQAACGVVLGLGGALALTRSLSTLLFGVSPLDPLTHAAVAGILLAVALLASDLPARRASRVDPVVALRSGS